MPTCTKISPCVALPLLFCCVGGALLSCHDPASGVKETRQAVAGEIAAPHAPVVGGGAVLAPPAAAAATAVAKVVQGTFTGTAQMKVWWDGTHLGVEAVYASPTALHTTAAQPWDADSIELYIDGNGNKGASYDGFDRQFVTTVGRALFEKGGRTAGVIANASASGNTLTVRYAVPWSNLGVTPGAGTTIGLDVGVNDGGTSGTRSGQAMAFGTASNWTDTSAWGAVRLAP